MTVAPRLFGRCSAHLWPIARPHISGRVHTIVLDVVDSPELSAKLRRVRGLHALVWASIWFLRLLPTYLSSSTSFSLSCLALTTRRMVLT
jgi:hypothetical protein